MLNFIKNIVGSENSKKLKKYMLKVKKINSLEKKYICMTDEILKNSFFTLKNKFKNNKNILLDDLLEETFALTREVSRRTLNMRHFDVQLIGGMALHDGSIAEMKTGEGKTLVATLPIVLNSLEDKGIHIVTVNDYLAKRDSEEMKPLFDFLGLSVGVVIEEIEDIKLKKQAYSCDVTYGTNNEFGFDFLRDNMAYDLEEIVQIKGHNFAIIDEIDSILIDEARTPLIISGPVQNQNHNYILANRIANNLKINYDFTVDLKEKLVLINSNGINNAEKLFGVKNLYNTENNTLPHLLNQALVANYCFSKDKDYVVQDNQVILVDEFTGRLGIGRRFSDGLHQALEAKEQVDIQSETQTYASITFQNYFRDYKKISGMTGTAATEATEFLKIYVLSVLSVPTNNPIKRNDLPDKIFLNDKSKYQAILKKIIEVNKTGQPILIGTASIESSEKLSKFLTNKKILHTLLNAKNNEKESEIIKKAGMKNSITIATNMAGRGVDIKLEEKILHLGLYILGTERHENRRIDNQLRGRAGRQGDNGVSQFYLSLEDNLLSIFGSDKLKSTIKILGLKENDTIETKMVSKAVEKAQERIENMYYENRKNIVEYDNIVNSQRKIIFDFRDKLLGLKEIDFSLEDKAIENINFFIESKLLSSLKILDDMEFSDNHKNKILDVLSESYFLKIDKNDFQNYEELKEIILNNVLNKFEILISSLSYEIKFDFLKNIYLEVLDNKWKNHLYEIDLLQSGIGLRAYNQKDPLIEFKKEMYFLFKNLLLSIKNDFGEKIFYILMKHQ